MREIAKTKKLHLKLPVPMWESLRPTGCRNSKEAEAAWRLGAAVDVLREFKAGGVMPILKQETLCEKKRSTEMHVPLCEACIDFLNNTATQEGGSRGKLVRELLMTAKAAIDGNAGSLTHEGLAAEIKKLFL